MGSGAPAKPSATETRTQSIADPHTPVATGICLEPRNGEPPWDAKQALDALFELVAEIASDCACASPRRSASAGTGGEDADLPLHPPKV